MRLTQLARHGRIQLGWKVVLLEIPTVFGMAIVAGPLGIFLRREYNVDESATYGLCVAFAYLGVRLFDRLARLLEKRDAESDKAAD